MTLCALNCWFSTWMVISQSFSSLFRAVMVEIQSPNSESFLHCMVLLILSEYRKPGCTSKYKWLAKCTYSNGTTL